MLYFYLLHILLIVEILGIATLIYLYIKNKMSVYTKLRFAAITVVNTVVHAIPLFYNERYSEEATNWMFNLLKAFTSAIEMFVGEVNTDDLQTLANDYGIFYNVIFCGLVLAVTNTLLTANNIFRNSIKNRKLLKARLSADHCDIVVGHNTAALEYVKSHESSILLVDDSVSKEAIADLTDQKIAVLRKNLANGFFIHPLFNKTTRYNIICPNNGNNVLEFVNSFVSYKNSHPNSSNFYLYVEIEADMAETIHREIIDKSKHEAYIITFCSTELLARRFVEKHPITRHLPCDYIENAAIKPETELNVYILGFDKLSRELYRQLILCNQLVTQKRGEYKPLPINYYICDNKVDPDEASMCGLADTLMSLKASEYFPIPDAPFAAEAIPCAPTSHEAITHIKKSLSRKNSYTYVIINTGDDCLNIEFGDKIKNLFYTSDNFRVFVKSDASYTQDNEFVTYFGKVEDVFCHDVIVNDAQSIIAKKLNEVYFSKNEGTKINDQIKAIAEKKWEKLSYFKLFSNIHQALNLRVILNLLKLDYIEDGKCSNLHLINERLQLQKSYTYEDYFKPSIRNALIAQEHTRWNAYHLINGYLPLEKNAVVVKSRNDNDVSLVTQIPALKRHACITTYMGLDKLSTHLAALAGNDHTPADHDYYQYDISLAEAIEDLFKELGYSIVDKEEK